MWACEHGHQSVVERILEQHPEAVGAQDSDGYTPLHRAAYSDFPEIVKVRSFCVRFFICLFMHSFIY